MRARNRLVSTLEKEGIDDPAVLAAIATVPRHEFVPDRLLGDAYANYPLPIGHDQTISQPYVVALMTQLLRLRAGERVLEIGTGSGYQAAVLAEIGCNVYTIEIIPELAEQAGLVLDRLGYDSIRQRVGDGWLGWPEEAPYDAIIVTAAPDSVPRALVEQLRPGARMILPLGAQTSHQMLTIVEKAADGSVSEREAGAVRFVPMIRRQ